MGREVSRASRPAGRWIGRIATPFAVLAGACLLATAPSSGAEPGAAAQLGGRATPARAVFEDTREGFPKIAAYRPTCHATAAQAAAFDWFVTDGRCASVLDAAHRLNPHLLGMIQPTIGRTGLLFAATYGSYLMSENKPEGDIRPSQNGDLLRDVNGDVHRFGTVTVLNWLSRNTAMWSADIVAYWAKRNGALGKRNPGIMGVWGDNDFWSNQSYAFTGTPLDPKAVGAATADANRVAWDTNYVLHHDRLAADLPGLVIGGNDTSSYSVDPGAYKGTIANGWRLSGVSTAGMRECADRYFGLYTASGVDSLITSAQRFLGSKALDGKQRYLILNNCNADSPDVNQYSLAVATIAGAYYWPYVSSDWTTTLTIAPGIPGYTRNGARHWLGQPVTKPVRLASGLWKRGFQHGVVYVNMSGQTTTVDGQTLANRTGLFAKRTRAPHGHDG